MKYTFTLASRKSLAAKTTAKETYLYHFNEGSDTLFFLYDAADKTTAASPSVIVSKAGLRFKQKYLSESAPVVVPPQTVYKNTAQRYTAKCGEGFTGEFTATVAAGRFQSNVSQADADAQALQAAKVDADASLVCKPVVVTPPPVPTGKGKRIAGFSTFTTTGSIAKDSDVLTLADDIGVQVGDTLAVIFGVTPLVDAKVLEVNGNKIKLSAAATIDMKDAKVVFDSTQTMIDYVRNNPAKKFDAKALGFGNEELFFRRVKWEPGFWNPATKDWFIPENITVDFGDLNVSSIPGAFPASFGVEYGIGDGNFQCFGGTINQAATEANLAATWYKEMPVQNPWLYCPAVGLWTNKGAAKGVKVVDPWAYGFWGNVDVEDCHVSNTEDGLKFYNGFWFLTFGGRIYNCSAVSKYLIRVLEIEGGDGGVVDGFKTVNGIAASNSSWNANFRNLDFRFTKNAASINPSLLVNPTLEIHDHIKGQAKNITVEDMTVTYEDFLDDKCGTLRGIVAKGQNVSNVTLRRIKIVHPDAPVKVLRGNGANTALHLGANDSLVEDFETNARLWEGFKKEDYLNSHDNTIISVTGARCTLRRVKAMAAVVAQDTVVEDCEFTYGFTRI